MELKRLLRELKSKLERDLEEIGGSLLSFDPETCTIEVDVQPDTQEMREYAGLIIKDALSEYFEKKDALLRARNPMCGVEKLLERNIFVDDLN